MDKSYNPATCEQCGKQLGFNVISVSTGDLVCSVKCEKEFMTPLGPIGDHSEDAKKGMEKFMSGHGVKPQSPSPQPQPSFTREETDTIGEALQLLFTEKHSDFSCFGYETLFGYEPLDALKKKVYSMGPPLVSPPTRLDLLIKFHGEQERPSEIEFRHKQEREMSSNIYLKLTKFPQADSTHYCRGTSEWISLEGVV